MIGAAMLIVAGIGLFTIEEKPQGDQGTTWTFHVSFPIFSGGQSSVVTVNDGASVDALITLDQPNMTMVGLAVTWVDNAPRFTSAATVLVELTDPNGTEAGTDVGNDGTQGFTINAGPQATAPAEYDIKAGSEGRAWQKVLDANTPTTNGTGGWKMKVLVTRGGFHPLRSGSADVSLELVFSYYQADLKLVGGNK